MRRFGIGVALLAVACTPPAPVDPPAGELLLLASGTEPVREYGLGGSTPTVDLGTVERGCTTTRPFVLRNVGPGQAGPRSLRVEGLHAPLVFVDFVPRSLAPDEAMGLNVVVSMPLSQIVPIDARVVLTWDPLDGASPEDLRFASFAVHALPVSSEYVEVGPVDFGAVERGDSAVHTITLVNHDVWRSTVSWQTPVGQEFSLAPDTEAGEYVLMPGAQVRVNVNFTPLIVAQHAGSISMFPLGPCDTVGKVGLRGDGVDQVLTFTPVFLGLGPVAVGSSTTGEVTFSNVAFTPVQLSSLAVFEGTVESSVCSVVNGTGAPLSALTVPPGKRATQSPTSATIIPGVARLHVVCQPTVAGVREATLRATTSLALHSAVAIPMRLEATP